MSTRVAEIGRPGVQIQHRTPVEKVAILLASLDNELAVELLKKLGSDDVKSIVESSAGLGSLTYSDVNPLVDEFAQEFAEALGISASREQLMALLEAAFSSDEIASFLGRPSSKPPAFSWGRFSMGMQGAIVPYILDEHPQTAAVVLSKLSPELAARSIEILPSGLRASITSRMLKIGEITNPALEILEKALQEDLLGEKAIAAGDDRLERLASIINRLDREQAEAILSDITKVNPEDGAGLRRLIFMFEDIAKLQPAHRARLMDRVSTDLLITALFGADQQLREVMLQSLSARTRRMVESELPAGESQPKKDTADCRRKIAEMAIAAAKSGEIELPDPNAEQPAVAAA